MPTGGHWETRRTLSPEGIWLESRVWVPDPKPKKKQQPPVVKANPQKAKAAANVAMSAAAARRYAAAVAAAQKKAARFVEEDRAAFVAAARAQAYKRLQEYQANLLSSAKKKNPSIVNPRKPLTPGQSPPRVSRNLDRRDLLPPQRPQNEEALRAQQLQQTRNQAAVQKALFDAKKKRVIADKKATPQQLENLLKEELTHVGPGPVNAQEVQEIMQQLSDKAEKFRDTYISEIDKLNKLVKRYNDKPSEALYRRAKEQQKKVLSLSSEYDLLFGNDSVFGKSDEGVIVRAYNAYDEILKRNEAWWASQMKHSLAESKQTLTQDIANLKRQGRVEEASGLEQLLEIYDGKTGNVGVRLPNGEIAQRKRTVEEELEFQVAARQVELERQYAAQQEEERMKGIRAVLEGRNKKNRLGEWVTPTQYQVEQDALELINGKKFQGVMPKLRNPEDFTAFGDSIVKNWLTRNPKPVALPGMPRQQFYDELAKWEARKAEYEKAAFAYIGRDAPAWWDRAIQTPGVSQSLALLQIPNSAIGTIARLTSKQLTGSSLINLGVSLSDLPEDLKNELGYFGPLAGLSDISSFLGGQKSLVVQQFLNTQRGKEWLVERLQALGTIANEQDAAFLLKFYDSVTTQKMADWELNHPRPKNARGSTGELEAWNQARKTYEDSLEGVSLGERVEALNQYGSQPTTATSSNLLFNLLGDPLNAIPLNFTKYLARAAFASQQTAGLSGLKKALKLPVEFVRVNDEALASAKDLRERAKDLGTTEDAMRAAVDKARALLANGETPSQLSESIGKLFRDIGISPELINPRQIESLVESLIQESIKDKGRRAFTQADETAKKMDEAEAARKAAEEARIKSTRDAERTAQAKRDAAREEVKKAREDLLDELEHYVPPTRPRDAREEFARYFDDLQNRVWAAEKESDPADWTAAERAAYDSGNMREFSRLRGYTEAEIAEFEELQKLLKSVPEKELEPLIDIISEGRQGVRGAELFDLIVKQKLANPAKATPVKPPPAATAAPKKKRAPRKPKRKVEKAREITVATRRNPRPGSKEPGAGDAVFDRVVVPAVGKTLPADAATRAIPAQTRSLPSTLKIQDPPSRSGMPVPAREALKQNHEIKHASEYYLYLEDFGAWYHPQYLGEDVIAELRAAVDNAKTAKQKDEATLNLYRAAQESMDHFRRVREDDMAKGPTRFFTPTDADFAQRGGVLYDPPAADRLMQDLQTTRYAARQVGRGNRRTVSGLVYNPGEGIVRLDELEAAHLPVGEPARAVAPPPKYPRRRAAEDDFDRAMSRPRNAEEDSVEIVTPQLPEIATPSGASIAYIQTLPAGVLPFGDELILAADSTVLGVSEIYSLFSGSLVRIKKFTGGWYTKVRDEAWRSKVSKRSFINLIERFDDGMPVKGGKLAYGEHPPGAAFRDGGQVLFELFHNIRLTDRNLDNLKRLSNYVDEFLEVNEEAYAGGAFISLFGSMWKLMESRAGLPWARYTDLSEAAFLAAAAHHGLHPNLALSMIPNGFFPDTYPTRFGLSTALKPLARNPRFSFHPTNWNERAALAALSDMFRGGPNVASRVTNWVAGRFGSFGKAWRFRYRIADELVNLVIDLKGGEDELAVFLGKTNDEIREIYKQLKDGQNGSYFNYDATLRARIFKLYDDNLLKIENPAVHQMILFARLQDNPDARLGVLEIYWNNMKSIGKEDHARVLVHELMGRDVAEVFRQVRMSVGDSGKVVEPDTKTFSFLKKVGLAPTQGQIEQMRMLNAVQDGIVYAGDDSQQMAHLKTFADDDEVSRNLEVASSRDLAGDAPVGTADISRQGATIEKTIAEYEDMLSWQGGPEPKLGQPAKTWREIAEERMTRIVPLMERMIFSAARGAGRSSTAVDMEEIMDLIASLRAHPLASSELFRRIGDRLGDVILEVDLPRGLTLVDYRVSFLEVKRAWLTTDVKGIAKHHAEIARVDAELTRLTSRTIPSRTRRAAPPLVIPSLGEVEDAAAVLRRNEILKETHESYDAWLARGGDKTPAKPKRTRRPKKPKDAPVPIDDAIEDAIGPAPIREPEEALESARMHEIHEAVTKMSEDEFHEHLLQRAYEQLRRANASPETKAKARRVIQKVQLAKEAKRLEAGGTPNVRNQARARRRYANRMHATHAKVVAGRFHPKSVAFYAEDEVAILVEEARSYNVMLSRYAPPKGASSSFKTQIYRRRPDKTIEHLDYFPKDIFDDFERFVAQKVGKAIGRTADVFGKTRRKAPSGDPDIARNVDKDPRVIQAKDEAVKEYAQKTGIFIPIEAYNDARAIFSRGGYYRARKTMEILQNAKSAFLTSGGDIGSQFLRLRKIEADRTAGVRLREIAYEKYGATSDEILAEFDARYGDDGVLKDYTVPMTAFQKASIEGAIKYMAGITDLADTAGLSRFLNKRNAAPFEKGQSATRDFLTRIGAWSPRHGEDFVAGRESWSITKEGDYWFAAYGIVPDWANIFWYADNPQFFQNPGFRAQQLREWGVYNSHIESMTRTLDRTLEQIREAHVSGDPVLGIKAKRELDALRRYEIDRYQELVSDDGFALKQVPWLMTPEEGRIWTAKQQLTGIAEELVQDVDEFDELIRLIRPLIDEFYDKYIHYDAVTGLVDAKDILRMSTEITARLLTHPKWKRRWRNIIGNTLGGFGALQRANVFLQPAFFALNAVDSKIKFGFISFFKRGMLQPDSVPRTPEIQKFLDTLTPHSIAIDTETTLLSYRARRGVDIALDPFQKGLDGAIERAGGIGKALTEYFPERAARFEIDAKMRLAHLAAPQMYTERLRAAKGNHELAEAWTRLDLKKFVSDAWRTKGNGPLENLFNQISPFASYLVKNQVFFIGQAFQHPVILNWIEYVGAYIESENRERWAIEHPDLPFDERNARRIELPWAPGYFLDLGIFTDASRGLNAFSTGESVTVKQLAGNWFRLVNGNTEAAFYAMMNALGVERRKGFKPILNDDGFLIGYEEVSLPWNEPWNRNRAADASSFLFPVAWAKMFSEFEGGGWTPGELSQFFGKVFLFEGIKPMNEDLLLSMMYYEMAGKNKAAANKWLAETPEGARVKAYFAVLAERPVDMINVMELNERWANDPRAWLHQESAEFQTAVKDGYQLIDKIQNHWGGVLAELRPGSKEFKDAKASMYLHIANVYNTTPELLRYEALGKSASEWSKTLANWETNRLTDAFFQLSENAPKRTDFKTTKEYDNAREQWRLAKQVFLRQYPQVAERVYQGRAEVQSARERVEKTWDETFKKIQETNELIAAAKKDGDEKALALLYSVNSLYFKSLEADTVALDYEEDDYLSTMSPDGGHRETVKSYAMKVATLLPDFSDIQLKKAQKEGREKEFLDERYLNSGVAAASLHAKGGKPNGKFDYFQFQRFIQSDSRLMRLYEQKNPGITKKWARTEEYRKYITRWGKALGNGNFELGHKIWNSLPEWVQNRYLKTNKKTDAEASFYGGKGGSSPLDTVKSSEFGSYMQQWTAYFDRDDAKGGMSFFWTMPKWVRERYFDAHPGKRDKWRKPLKTGKELDEYFKLPKEQQAEYLKNHPELQEILAKNQPPEEQHYWNIHDEYSKIPKTEPWLRRIFREAHPEVFSKEAIGLKKLEKVFRTLAAYPAIEPDFERWVEAIYETYTQMIKLSAPRPRPVEFTRAPSIRDAWTGISAAEAARRRRRLTGTPRSASVNTRNKVY